MTHLHFLPISLCSVSVFFLQSKIHTIWKRHAGANKTKQLANLFAPPLLWVFSVLCCTWSRRDVFTLDVMAVPQGSGSGFIWDKKGHIVTNYHVIRGASDLRYVCLPSSSSSTSSSFSSMPISIILQAPDCSAPSLATFIILWAHGCSTPSLPISNILQAPDCSPHCCQFAARPL